MFYGFYVFTLSLVKGFVLINNFKRLKKGGYYAYAGKGKGYRGKNRYFGPGDSGSDRYEKRRGEGNENDGEAKEQR
jgi:hypothetical protein